MSHYTSVEKLLVKKKLECFLQEDVRFGDITSAILNNTITSAVVLCKTKGIVCGIAEAKLLCEMGNLEVTKALQDGEEVEKDTEIMQISGYLHDILIIERTLLNIMMRMSSIASMTHAFTQILQDISPKVKIAATRKTTPGFRLFEKRAVMIGGKNYADTHRWSLDDMVLLKDTHLSAYHHNIPDLISIAKKTTSFTKKIELEVQTPEDALMATKVGVDIIMFDNMSPKKIHSTIVKIKKEVGAEKIPLFEASGNITLENIAEYAKSGVDIISSSQITFLPSKKIDISLEIQL